VIGKCKDIEILEQYKDRRIKIINHEKNMGLPYSLNEGMRVAKGEYIARMDSDDISLKNRLKVQVEFLDKYKDIDVCSMFAKRIGNDNALMIHPFIKNELIHEHLTFSNCIIHPLVMFRKEFIERHNLYYNEEFLCSQDFELWNRCKKYGKIAIIPKIGLFYRVHNKQISTQKKERQHEMFKRIVSNNLREINLAVTNEIENNILLLFSLENNTEENIIKLSSLVEKIVLNTNKNNAESLKKVLYYMLFNRFIRMKKVNKIKLITQNKIIKKQIIYNNNIKLLIKKQYIKLLEGHKKYEK